MVRHNCHGISIYFIIMINLTLTYTCISAIGSLLELVPHWQLCRTIGPLLSQRFPLASAKAQPMRVFESFTLCWYICVPTGINGLMYSHINGNDHDDVIFKQIFLKELARWQFLRYTHTVSHIVKIFYQPNPYIFIKAWSTANVQPAETTTDLRHRQRTWTGNGKSFWTCVSWVFFAVLRKAECSPFWMPNHFERPWDEHSTMFFKCVPDLFHWTFCYTWHS